VKLRGFRIEPGEIEAALVRHGAVAQAAVIAREDRPGDKRLVAYVVAAAGGSVDAAALRAQLGASLPDYMVPSAVVVLERLPLTANGKLDRAALPPPPRRVPENGGPASAVTRPPRSETERALAGIWEDLLATQVSVDDDFFALGGHSLLATRMTARIRAGLGIEVPLRRLFELRTLDALARYVDGVRWAASSGPDGLDAGQAAVEDGVL
jgi:acyl carrier protein